MFRGQRLWLSWQSSSLRYHRYRSSNPANDKINYRTCTYLHTVEKTKSKKKMPGWAQNKHKRNEDCIKTDFSRKG